MIPKPEVRYPDDGSVAPVRRYVWSPVPAAPDTRDRQGWLRGKRLMIVGGAEGTAARVANRIEKAGASIARYDGTCALPVDGIIDLNIEEPFSLAAKDAWRGPLTATVTLLKSVYRDWAGETDARRLCYVPVTSMGGRMGYGGEVAQPLGGIWAGLAKTLPREIPNLNVKVIDVSPEDHAGIDEILARGLGAWGPFEIGHARGERFCLAARSEEVPPPAFTLTPGEIVLISGGGRGLGFALALALARNFGCRVVVTGRSPAPAGSEPWLTLDENEFKNYRYALLKSAPPGSGLARARSGIEHLGRLRDLHGHLRKVAAEGLPVEYRVCDFTRLDEVRSLIDSLGPRLSGIVHNAGIDTPRRLGGKPIESFLDTVDVKVSGFLNILEALGNRPLKFLSNTGSLTGRMGGMVGQLDYAAANDGLARLGLWAARNTPHRVSTLCWPTWEKVGMIANYGATLKYMSALNLEEGLYHWQRELMSGRSGEVTFIGPFGKALSPVHMNGYPLIPDLPGAGELFSHWFYLGEAAGFRPFTSIRSRNRIPLQYAPGVHAFRYRGRPALPPGILIEFAASAGKWVQPEEQTELVLEQLRDIRIHMPSLGVRGDAYEFEKEAHGKWVGGKWVVDVRLAGIAEMRLVYGSGATAAPLPPRHAAKPYPGANRRMPAHLEWPGVLFRAAWFSGDGIEFTGELNPRAASDLWSTPLVPGTVLAPGALENLLQFVLGHDPADGDELSVAGIALFAGAGECRFITGSLATGEWHLLDAQGRAAASVFGITRKAGSGAVVHPEALQPSPSPDSRRMRR